MTDGINLRGAFFGANNLVSERLVECNVQKSETLQFALFSWNIHILVHDDEKKMPEGKSLMINVEE